ncbi:hypothetical protein J2Y41_004653 [Arthrobacter sp. 1088]|uniref:hypothetical protein n=1 Tax=Arthrobacter sp. 1088 TaxID=2817768 RepID=UPI00285CE588|nr:hypothetical protein [Arthrobacter sp. 1088]MDR6689049.1 hypothetical protein [Arthrobacter sp. 1088]
MNTRLEVPQITDLHNLPLDVVNLDSPGVVRISGLANDGSTVDLTWDELALSVRIRLVDGGQERLVIERETALKVSINKEDDQVLFSLWSEWQGTSGKLTVRIGEHVSITDLLLRT